MRDCRVALVLVVDHARFGALENVRLEKSENFINGQVEDNYLEM